MIASGSKLSIKPIGLNPNNASFIQGWEVITPDGLRFVFNVKETSSTRYSISLEDLCRSLMERDKPPQSWYLAEISSPSTNSSISFQYDDYFQTSERWSMETQIHNQRLAPAIPRKEKMIIDTSGKYLRRISTSSGETTIEFIPGSVRTDVKGTANNKLHTLGAVKTKNGNNIAVKNWEFGYDYSVGRLTLKSVQEKLGDQAKPPYQFDYYRGTLPDPLSEKRDHWGFYNTNAARTLIPATVASRVGDPDIQ